MTLRVDTPPGPAAGGVTSEGAGTSPLGRATSRPSCGRTRIGGGSRIIGTDQFVFYTVYLLFCSKRGNLFPLKKCKRANKREKVKT